MISVLYDLITRFGEHEQTGMSTLDCLWYLEVTHPDRPIQIHKEWTIKFSYDVGQIQKYGAGYRVQQTEWKKTWRKFVM